MKVKLILMVCVLLLIPTISLGEEMITELDLGTPSFLTLSIEGEKFIISWKNPANIYGLRNIDYQIDYKVGRGEWASLNKDLKSNYLPFSADGRTRVEIDPKAEGISDNIDLDNNNYSFRVRYSQRLLKDGVNSRLDGFFSSPVSLGLRSYYQNASAWAFEELDRAVGFSMVPDSIRDDMKKEITREEFSEIIVRLYELQTGSTVNYDGQSFVDTDNPEVLKAARLGIVNGVGGGKFAPDNLVTRQEIAVMLVRTLKVVNPDLDLTYDDSAYTSESNIASWAKDPVFFMRSKEILKGDDKGLINPLGHTTREQAVILALRTHDTF